VEGFRSILAKKGKAAYQFVPCNNLEMIKELKKHPIIIDHLGNHQMVHKVKIDTESFVDVWNKMSHQPHWGFHIADTHCVQIYEEQFKALGVTEMTQSDYENILQLDWISSLTNRELIMIYKFLKSQLHFDCSKIALLRVDGSMCRSTIDAPVYFPDLGPLQASNLVPISSFRFLERELYNLIQSENMVDWVEYSLSVKRPSLFNWLQSAAAQVWQKSNEEVVQFFHFFRKNRTNLSEDQISSICDKLPRIANGAKIKCGEQILVPRRQSKFTISSSNSYSIVGGVKYFKKIRNTIKFWKTPIMMTTSMTVASFYGTSLVWWIYQKSILPKQ
jgi:hypothetical protein